MANTVMPAQAGTQSIAESAINAHWVPACAGMTQLAIVREKRLKKWNRAWKLRLIEEMNPDWDDLYESIL